MGLRVGTALSHMVLLPFAVLVLVALSRLYMLFKATEAGRAWRVALLGAGSFVFHQLACFLYTLLGSSIPAVLVRATGFLTLIGVGATVLAIYRTFAPRMAPKDRADDPSFTLRGPTATLPDGDEKEGEPPCKRPYR